MKSIQNLKIFNSNVLLSINIDEDMIDLFDQASEKIMVISFKTDNSDMHLQLVKNSFEESSDRVFHQALDLLFSQNKHVQRLWINSNNLIPYISHVEQEKALFKVVRSDFYKTEDVWGALTLKNESVLKNTFLRMVTDQREHPVRPLITEGTKYMRYVLDIDATITIRTVNIDKDLDQFHNWQNKPRVYSLWELNKPKDELKSYLEKGKKDLHQVPLILEFNGESMGYVEVYWAPEDRIGPFYEYKMYDRGFHFLIGEEKFLGVANTFAALKAVAHLLFMDNSRTERIVGEPRYDNARALKYVHMAKGWEIVKEFDFPHKRAALIMGRKDLFFEGEF